MPRKKTEAAEPQTEPLGKTLPAVAAQEGEYIAAKRAEIERIEAMFQFPVVYDRDEDTAALRSTVTQAALLHAYGGALLLRIKAHESHGDFLRIAQEAVGKSKRAIQRMMLAARAMLDQNGKPRPILLAISGTKGEVHKLHELMNATEEELDALDAGESIGDLSIDTAPVMSASELRDALAAKDKLLEQKQALIDKQNDDIEKQDRVIGKLKRGGREVVEAAYIEVLAEATDLAHLQFDAMRRCVAKLSEATEQLTTLQAPEQLGDEAICDAVKATYAEMVQVGSTLAALIQKYQASLAHYIDRPDALLDETLDGAAGE